MEYAMLFAVLIGPVLAVMVTRFIDGKTKQYDRRYEVLRSMLKNMDAPVVSLPYVDFAGALNLIQIEFSDKRGVIEKWKTLMNHYNMKFPDAQDEQMKFTDERRKAIIRLINEIAIVLGIKIEQLDVLDGRYAPMGWASEAQMSGALKMRMLEVLSGNSALKVEIQDVSRNV